MRSLRTYILEANTAFLDADTVAELNELNTLSPEELKKTFSVLNYKADSKEAKEILNNLSDKIIEVLKKYKYATTSGKYYDGICSLFCRTKLENYVARKLNNSKDVSNVKQVSHEINKNEKYNFTSSIGTICTKYYFYDDKNFIINKHENKGVEWLCFVDMDLSDVTNFKNKWGTSKLYLVNVKKMFDKSNTYAIGHSFLQDKGDHFEILMKDVKELADYVI